MTADTQNDSFFPSDSDDDSQNIESPKDLVESTDTQNEPFFPPDIESPKDLVESTDTQDEPFFPPEIESPNNLVELTATQDDFFFPSDSDNNSQNIELAKDLVEPTMDATDEEFELSPINNTIEVSPIIKRFGTWAVTKYGVECLSQKYDFSLDRVDEEDWVDHMRETKIWVNMYDFESALSYARKLKKSKEV